MQGVGSARRPHALADQHEVHGPEGEEQRHALTTNGVRVPDQDAEDDQGPKRSLEERSLAAPVEPPERQRQSEQVRELGQDRVGPAHVGNAEPDEQHERRRGDLVHAPAQDLGEDEQEAGEERRFDDLQEVVVDTAPRDERRQQQREAPRVRVRAERAPRRVVHGEPVVSQDVATRPSTMPVAWRR